MHLSTIFTSFALLAVSVRASTIVAYSGNTCNGAVGDTVQCDRSCHSFTDRHSLKVSGGGRHCVTYFQQPGCVYEKDKGAGDYFDSDVCKNVNTGSAVGSFTCS